MSAEKGGKRGRAKGGVIIGVKNNFNANFHIAEKWFAKITLKTNNKNYNIFIGYLIENREKILKVLRDELKLMN